LIGYPVVTGASIDDASCLSVMVKKTKTSDYAAAYVRDLVKEIGTELRVAHAKLAMTTTRASMDNAFGSLPVAK
jgi:hypothetical protein